VKSRLACVAGKRDHEVLIEYSRFGGTGSSRDCGGRDVGESNCSIQTGDSLLTPREVVLNGHNGVAADAGHGVEGRSRRNRETVVEGTAR